MKNILITGANQGIGFFFVQQTLTNGNRVFVLDIETDNLETLKLKFPDRLFFYKGNVCDEMSMNTVVTDIIKQFQKVDIAIHNACLCTFGKETDTDLNTYNQVFDVNYFGALRLVKAVVPYMKDQKRGKIIFTSSGVGVTGFIGISPYASTKGALESLAKCLNVEYASYGLSFHIIHPPLTRTKSSAALPVPKDFMADPQKVGFGIAKNINSNRFIICHSLLQKIQTLGCYFFPIKMGKLMSKMTLKYIDNQKIQ